MKASIETQKYIDMHDSVVKDVLDKTDIPFARVKTHWFKKGQQHKYKGKVMKIECDEPILISSYIEIGDGRFLRVSNHKKKLGITKDIAVDCVYNWESGKLDNKIVSKLKNI